VKYLTVYDSVLALTAGIVWLIIQNRLQFCIAESVRPMCETAHYVFLYFVCAFICLHLCICIIQQPCKIVVPASGYIFQMER